jgi:hypothetical protein
VARYEGPPACMVLTSTSERRGLGALLGVGVYGFQRYLNMLSLYLRTTACMRLPQDNSQPHRLSILWALVVVSVCLWMCCGGVPPPTVYRVC